MLRPYTVPGDGPRQFPPHGHAHDRQIPTEVRLHQHPNRPSSLRRRQPPARSADPALPSKRDGPPPRAHRPFGDGSLGRAVNGGEHVCLGDRTGADVAEKAVVRLGDHGVGRADVLVARAAEQPGEHGVGGAGDAQRAGQHDGRLELSQLVDLRRARELPEPVPDDDRRGDLVAKRIAAVRQNRGDAGVDRIPAGDRCVADAHAGDVGDCIEGARGEGADDDAEVAGAGAGLGGQGSLN